MRLLRPATTAIVIAAFAMVFSVTAGAQAVAPSPPPSVPTAGVSPTAPAANEVQPATDAAKMEAIVRFKRGIELYEEGAFGAALTEFRRANELAPNWRLFYNIGQVCAQIRNYACALTSFKEYVTMGGSALPPERRTEVEDEIARLRARVAVLVIRANVDGADVSIDDFSVGRTPLAAGLTVNSGHHKITLTKPGLVPVTRQIDIAGQETLAVEMILFLAPPTVPAPAPADRMPSSGGMTTLSWVGVGAAGALAITAAFAGGFALSAASDARSTTYTRLDDGVSDRNRAQTLALVTDVAAGLAVVTLGTTLALTFWPRRSGTSNARIGPTGVEGTF